MRKSPSDTGSKGDWAESLCHRKLMGVLQALASAIPAPCAFHLGPCRPLCPPHLHTHGHTVSNRRSHTRNLRSLSFSAPTCRFED